MKFIKQQSRCSIVVSIPACHAGDPGSIPGNGVLLFSFLFFAEREIEMTSFYSWHGKGQKYGTLSTCIPCCYWKVSKYQLQPN